ncbi:MAG: hypothetical protein QOF57_1146, partial [Frankiaceae bacterium]|nr:hypothetical protein [Frankiaceae bacterium]
SIEPVAGEPRPRRPRSTCYRTVGECAHSPSAVVFRCSAGRRADCSCRVRGSGRIAGRRGVAVVVHRQRGTPDEGCPVPSVPRNFSSRKAPTWLNRWRSPQVLPRACCSDACVPVQVRRHVDLLASEVDRLVQCEGVAMARRRYAMAERVGALAFDSRAIGWASTLFGISTLRAGERLLNRKAARTAIGWSVRTLEGPGSNGTRAARWTFRAVRRDLLHGPILFGGV